MIRLEYDDGGSMEVGMTLDCVGVDTIRGLILNDLGFDVFRHGKTREMDKPNGMKEVRQDVNMNSHFIKTG